jgi:hypothetical protein
MKGLMMVANKKDSFRTYEDLLAMQAIDDLDNGYLKKYRRMADDDDDMELFVTSKEIVKNKELAEKVADRSHSIINNGPIEESVHYKRYSSRRVHKYTESEMEEIRSSCISTIVHDYGEHDIYHLSDEDRRKNDMLAEISLKLCGLKRTYRQINQYIEAMRVVFEAWKILEKNNYVHSREEFFQMVAEGKIVSNRIIMPKMKRLDQYNLDLIIAYISNPDLDANNLVPPADVKHDSFYDFDYDYDIDKEAEIMSRVISQAEGERIQYLEEHPDEIPELKISYMKPKYIKGYDRREITKKKKKKESKKDKRIRKSVAAMLNKIQTGVHYRDHGHSYIVTHSLFEPEKSEKSFWDSLYFDGSWADNDEVALYDMAINEEILKQKPPRERYLTYGDKELDAFFTILEESGVSAVDLRRKMGEVEQKSDQKRTERSRKDNKKIESALLQRITKLNKNPKFKKIIKKSEDALNRYKEDER